MCNSIHALAVSLIFNSVPEIRVTKRCLAMTKASNIATSLNLI
ncbi:hypothetical protein BURPS668_A0219 [Burkholderia pseudomallei 668]|nr:hypothetical protein BURPS668_A0219 [Burkholderia pseudomallei 668]